MIRDGLICAWIVLVSVCFFGPALETAVPVGPGILAYVGVLVCSLIAVLRQLFSGKARGNAEEHADG